MKKIRKLSRKGKLLVDDQNLDEKKEMINALVVKCNKTPEVSQKKFNVLFFVH